MYNLVRQRVEGRGMSGGNGLQTGKKLGKVKGLKEAGAQ